MIKYQIPKTNLYRFLKKIFYSFYNLSITYCEQMFDVYLYFLAKLMNLRLNYNSLNLLHFSRRESNDLKFLIYLRFFLLKFM